MLEMPRPRHPYLVRQVSRHGTEAWYVRRTVNDVRTAIRIRAKFGTPEFDEQYQAAMAGTPVRKVRTQTGSLKWLWERYCETGAWLALKKTTRRQRENIMAHVIEKSGVVPAGDFLPMDITAGKEARAATPAQAKGFLVCMRKLFGWGVTAGHVATDPTVGIKAFPRKKTNGFPIWTEAEVERYQERWPVGTKERVWIDVLLYTGLRRGDAVMIGRQHVKDGIATLKTEKGQGNVTVVLPILPILAATLKAGPCADLAFICGAAGKPLTKASFGNNFREACDKAGVFGKSAHGLRKVGATRAADNGATVHELEAIFGWEGGAMAALYTKAADRRRASLRAMQLLEKGQAEPPIATPKNLVWQSGKKQ